MLQSTEWNNHESVLVWGCLVCGDILLVYLLNGNLLFMKFRQTSYFSFIEGMCRIYSGEIIRLSLCRMQPHHASSRILFFFGIPSTHGASLNQHQQHCIPSICNMHFDFISKPILFNVIPDGFRWHFHLVSSHKTATSRCKWILHSLSLLLTCCHMHISVYC